MEHNYSCIDVTTNQQSNSLSTVSLLFTVLPRAGACLLCLPFPTTTVADALIESQLVVFAREDHDKPFTYRPVQVLKGSVETGNIDLFVNSTTRRMLQVHASDVVVLIRETEEGPWKSLGIADEEYQQVIHRILALSQDWVGKNGTAKRCAFFAQLLGHDNRAIFELSYLELGRAPYSTIKRVARLMSVEDLLPILQKREYFKWRSLAILMLAQDADVETRKLIKDRFEVCCKFAVTTNLGAWAAAFIEIEGTSAIDLIQDHYLRDTNRTEEEIQAVITALSIHGQDGRAGLRDRIASSYGVALQYHPYIAGRIANDLADWKKWEYRNDIEKLLAEARIEFTDSEAKAIPTYLK